MTAEEWRERAERATFDGVPLVVGPDEYAELVRLRLAHDPLDMADHSRWLFDVPLVFDPDRVS